MRDTVAHPENSPPVFRLDFSGRGTLDRAAQVRAQMALTDPADHVAHARLASILAGALVATDPPGAHAAAEVATRHADVSGLDDARAWALLARSARNLLRGLPPDPGHAESVTRRGERESVHGRKTAHPI